MHHYHSNYLSPENSKRGNENIRWNQEKNRVEYSWHSLTKNVTCNTNNVTWLYWASITTMPIKLEEFSFKTFIFKISSKKHQ